MNKKLIAIASAAIVLAIAAYAISDSPPETAPVDIKASTQGSQNILEFTALEDDLKINNIVVNRGNCEAKLVYTQTQMIMRKPRPRFPVALQYGQSTTAWTFMKGCNLREVTAETNKGDWTWTWN